MKKIFFIIGVAAFSFAAAQDNGKPYLKIIPPKSKPVPYLFHNGKDSFWLRNSNVLNQSPQLIPQSKLLYTLPNGNKVYSLPQDNMRCVVPDMSQYNTMALVIPGKNRYNNIPNVANPPQPKIEKASPEKLKELQDYFNKKQTNNN
jgi:hypothetical protein